MTAIIFGASGQDGHYLSRLLDQMNIQWIGISRSEGYLNIDISNFEEVSRLVRRYEPHYIFHFAANSTTNHSAWKENHDTISTGSLNILEAVKQFSPSAKVFLTGSGLQFQNNNKPIKESDAFEGKSIYAVARIHSVYAARYYRTLGIKAYVGYLFTHDSPLRTDDHINKRIVDAAKRIANGSKEKLVIGDPSVQKEFGFAGDIVKGIWMLATQEQVWEATIGTGKAYTIEAWVERCFKLRGLNWKDHVEPAADFKRQYDILVSDPSTIFSLGWHPEISMEQLATMMMS
jgi:GDPmannose 4,6-dehydratase